MPFMKDSTISQNEIDGSIEISTSKYSELLQAKLDGFDMTVRDGVPLIFSKTMRTVYKTSDASKLEIPDNDITPDGYQDTQPAVAPIIVSQFSSNDFFDRFTPAEQVAVATETYSNVQVKIFYDKMFGANFVDVTDAETIGGINYLISLSLLNAGRKDAVLATETV